MCILIYILFVSVNSRDHGSPIKKALQKEANRVKCDHVEGCRYSDGLIEGRVDGSMNNKV